MIRRTPFVNVCSQGYGWGFKNIFDFACLLLILKSDFQHYDHHYHHHDYHYHCLSQCQGKFIITSSGVIDIIIIIIIISLVTALCTVTLQFICSYHFKRKLIVFWEKRLTFLILEDTLPGWLGVQHLLGQTEFQLCSS